MRPRFEIKRGRVAVPAYFLVVGGAGTDWHRAVRQGRYRHQQRSALLLDLIELDFQPADLLTARFVGRKDVGGIFALPLGAGDLVAGGILIPLEAFHFGDQPAAARFEDGNLLQVSVRIQATIAQARSDVLHVIAHESGIEHPTILYRYRGSDPGTVLRYDSGNSGDQSLTNL